MEEVWKESELDENILGILKNLIYFTNLENSLIAEKNASGLNCRFREKPVRQKAFSLHILKGLVSLNKALYPLPYLPSKMFNRILKGKQRH